MVGAFKVEKAFKNYAYMLVEKDEGIIENISACSFFLLSIIFFILACINILGISLKKLAKRSIKIIDLVNN